MVETDRGDTDPPGSPDILAGKGPEKDVKAQAASAATPAVEIPLRIAIAFLQEFA